MMFLFLFLVFLIVAASCWFHGLWGNAINLINLLVAMLIATNLYEPICTLLEGFGASSWTHLLDFVVLWILFFFTYTILKLITNALSRTHVKFDLPVEMAGRSILAIWCGWLFVCFTAFSLHMAPLNSATPLGAWSSPNSSTFLFASPDRLWMAVMSAQSRGALARGKFSSDHATHPDDQTANVEAFDPYSEFALKYRERRAAYAAETAMRTAQ
jgi:hypothetical protein